MFGFADGTNNDARFDHPNGVTIDRAGNLFVVDHYNHTIRKMSLLGTNWVVSTVAGLAGYRNHNDGTNSNSRFYSPTGIAIDDAGNLGVVDTANFTVRKIEPIGADWVVTTPVGVALDYDFVDGTNTVARFNFPYDITWSGGKFYVSDWGNHAIRQIAVSGPDWIVTTIAGFSGDFGSVDGTGKKAKFYFPNGIVADKEGIVYVCDQNNHTIRRLTPPAPHPPSADWMVSTIGGETLQLGSADGIGSAARFNKPWGITIDRAGNLYVADYANHIIRKGVPPWGPIPTLQIELAASQVVLSWPGSATNYVLETQAAFLPGQPWSSLTNGITLLSNRFVLSRPLTSSTGFYRLRRL
jgi:sugar lactone lactonase YvrE